MTALRLFRSALVLLLAMVVAVPLYAQARATQNVPKIDQKAVDTLRQMGDYLAGLQAFSVHVETTRDLVLPSYEALSSDMAYDLTVKRPDGMRIEKNSAAGRTVVLYNGKDLTVFTPAKNYYAVTPAPATIEATLAEARKRGMSLPLADLFYTDPGKRLMANVTSATFVGSSLVDGVMTNQLAFRQKGVDWQIWIEDSATPLPRKVVIIDRSAQNKPRFVATLSNWNTNPVIDECTFQFVPPEGAKKINFGDLPRPATRGKPAPPR